MKENEVASGRRENTKDLASERLLSSEAWGDFLSKLDVAGRRFLEKEFPGSGHMAALAYRYLLRLIRSVTEWLLEFADPDRPVFIRTFDLGLAYGLDNPDTLYHVFLALPGRTYCLRGEPAGKGKPPPSSFLLTLGVLPRAYNSRYRFHIEGWGYSDYS